VPHRRENTIETYGWAEALHESLYRSELPIKAIAEEMGVSVSYLRNAADSDQPEASLSARHLPLLARLTSNLAWLDYMERRAGRVAVRVPSGSGAHVHALGALARKTGEVLQQVADNLVDERITLAEWREVDKNIDDVLKAAALLREALMQRVDGGISRDEARGVSGRCRAACAHAGDATH